MKEGCLKCIKKLKRGLYLSEGLHYIQYSFPTSTLSDRVSGPVSFNSHSGPTSYLTDDAEEEELVSFGLC